MKFAYLVIILAIIVIIAVVGLYFIYNHPTLTVQHNNSTVTVQNGDNVSVFYTGSFTNGTVFNSNVGQAPFSFIVGSNQTIVGFNNAVLGMSLNQNKTVTIPPNQAYGAINQSLIVRIPISDFQNQSIKIGSIVSTSSNGQGKRGIVTFTNSTYAIVDFNSPLAGKTLVFNIRVVGIKKS